VVAQQGRLLLHSVMIVGSARAVQTEEGTREASGGLAVVSTARIIQSMGRKNIGGASSHHRVDMPGVAVHGDRVIH
jgi:hypothetical protein